MKSKDEKNSISKKLKRIKFKFLKIIHYSFVSSK